MQRRKGSQISREPKKGDGGKQEKVPKGTMKPNKHNNRQTDPARSSSLLLLGLLLGVLTHEQRPQSLELDRLSHIDVHTR
jgi:hypothetical protein